VLLLLVIATMARHYHASDQVRNDIPTATGEVGGRLADFTLPDLNGNEVSLSQFEGQGPILLTFDRSVDW